MFILVPLAFLRRLDSLRHTSYVALFSVGESLLCCEMSLFHLLLNTVGVFRQHTSFSLLCGATLSH